MNNLSPFRKWMVTNKYFTRDKNYTHLLLDGGKINIPENINEQFLNLYSKDIESSNPNIVCTNIAPTFKNKPIFKIPPRQSITAPIIRTFLPNLIS